MENGTQLGAAVADIGHGKGEMGQAVDEIVGAVDRVDHPQPGCGVPPYGVLFVGAHFFAQHRAVDDLRQAFGKHGLGVQVGFGEAGTVAFGADGGVEKTRHHGGLCHFANQFC